MVRKVRESETEREGGRGGEREREGGRKREVEREGWGERERERERTERNRTEQWLVHLLAEIVSISAIPLKHVIA